MNAFAQYADAAAPKRPMTRAQRKAGFAPSKLEQALDEKARLSKRYKLWKRQQNNEVLASEPRLKDFLRYLKTVQPSDGAELIGAVETSWLPDAPQPVRIFALRMIGARCDKLNRQMGFAVLDDPLPPETTVYFQARDLLHDGGRA
jgi:hypothetical protein